MRQRRTGGRAEILPLANNAGDGVEKELWSVTRERGAHCRSRYWRCRSRWSSRPSGLHWWRWLARRRCSRRAELLHVALQYRCPRSQCEQTKNIARQSGRRQNRCNSTVSCAAMRVAGGLDKGAVSCQLRPGCLVSPCHEGWWHQGLHR